MLIINKILEKFVSHKLIFENRVDIVDEIVASV